MSRIRCRPTPRSAAYRIVQEALTNTVKHARAGAYRVRLDWHDDALIDHRQ